MSVDASQTAPRLGSADLGSIEITSTTTLLRELKGGTMGTSIEFNLHNTRQFPVRAQLKVVGKGSAERLVQDGILKLKGSATRELEIGGVERVTVLIDVPPDTPPDRFEYGLVAFNEANPEDDYAHSQIARVDWEPPPVVQRLSRRSVVGSAVGAAMLTALIVTIAWALWPANSPQETILRVNNHARAGRWGEYWDEWSASGREVLLLSTIERCSQQIKLTPGRRSSLQAWLPLFGLTADDLFESLDDVPRGDEVADEAAENDDRSNRPSLRSRGLDKVADLTSRMVTEATRSPRGFFVAAATWLEGDDTWAKRRLIESGRRNDPNAEHIATERLLLQQEARQAFVFLPLCRAFEDERFGSRFLGFNTVRASDRARIDLDLVSDREETLLDLSELRPFETGDDLESAPENLPGERTNNDRAALRRYRHASRQITLMEKEGSWRLHDEVAERSHATKAAPFLGVWHPTKRLKTDIKSVTVRLVGDEIHATITKRASSTPGESQGDGSEPGKTLEADRSEEFLTPLPEFTKKFALTSVMADFSDNAEFEEIRTITYALARTDVPGRITIAEGGSDAVTALWRQGARPRNILKGESYIDALTWLSVDLRAYRVKALGGLMGNRVVKRTWVERDPLAGGHGQRSELREVMPGALLPAPRAEPDRAMAPDLLLTFLQQSESEQEGLRAAVETMSGLRRRRPLVILEFGPADNTEPK